MGSLILQISQQRHREGNLEQVPINPEPYLGASVQCCGVGAVVTQRAAAPHLPPNPALPWVLSVAAIWSDFGFLCDALGAIWQQSGGWSYNSPVVAEDPAEQGGKRPARSQANQ